MYLYANSFFYAVGTLLPHAGVLHQKTPLLEFFDWIVAYVIVSLTPNIPLGTGRAVCIATSEVLTNREGSINLIIRGDISLWSRRASNMSSDARQYKNVNCPRNILSESSGIHWRKSRRCVRISVWCTWKCRLLLLAALFQSEVSFYVASTAAPRRNLMLSIIEFHVSCLPYPSYSFRGWIKKRSLAPMRLRKARLLAGASEKGSIRKVFHHMKSIRLPTFSLPIFQWGKACRYLNVNQLGLYLGLWL